MSYQERRLQDRWQGYIGVVPAAYHALAFAIGAAQIFFIPRCLLLDNTSTCFIYAAVAQVFTGEVDQ